MINTCQESDAVIDIMGRDHDDEKIQPMYVVASNAKTLYY